MIGVDGSWVATVGRPPQLAFALSQVVRALLGCSWAVLPIHLLFRACPHAQTETKKYLAFVRRSSQKHHVAH